MIIHNKTSSPNDIEFARFDCISTLAKILNGYLSFSNGYLNHKDIFRVSMTMKPTITDHITTPYIMLRHGNLVILINLHINLV